MKSIAADTIFGSDMLMPFSSGQDPLWSFPFFLMLVFSFRTIEHKMMSDASEMLAAALEQMDGIIAGNHSEHLDSKTWE